MGDALKLEAGKYYRDRGGRVWGPMEAIAWSGDYHFRGADGELWTRAGSYHLSSENSPYDLIEKAPDPQSDFAEAYQLAGRVEATPETEPALIALLDFLAAKAGVSND